MRYLRTIEQVQGWLGNEIIRLQTRLGSKLIYSAMTIQEENSLRGSILSLQKLKGKIDLRPEGGEVKR